MINIVVVDLGDVETLRQVTPVALTNYALLAGWEDSGVPYREYSRIYRGDDLPLLKIPEWEGLGDYAQVVRGLLADFAEVTRCPKPEIFCELMGWRE